MILFVIGIFCGWLSATITESVGHKLTGHPGDFQRKLYLKYPHFFSAFLKPFYQHLVIHHHRTFKGEFFDQFKSEKEKYELDKWISKTFSKKFSDLIWKERYNLTLKGIGGILPFALPFCVGPALIGYALGSHALYGSLVCAFLPVWLSKYIHPLIHLPQETYRSNFFIRWLMRTSYMRQVFRNHYLHHQELNTNFNLLLGGDYLVFLHRSANEDEKLTLQVLLSDFDRRVRSTGSQKEATRLIYSQPENRMAVEEFKDRELAYLDLKNPTDEQRFSHQKWKAKAFLAARENGQTEVLQFCDVGRKMNFGFRLYQKGINFTSWSKKSKFSIENYEFDSEGVFYRGVYLQTGDLFLTNQNCDSDGLFSTLLEERINFSHVAMFCILQRDGKKYPAVVEMNEDGVRAVPLKVHLSEEFNTYVEVFRPQLSLSSELRSKLSEAAVKVMKERHAFDIFQDTTQQVFLNCARAVDLIYRVAGLSMPMIGSRYSTATFKNLKILGIDKSARTSFLMPDDYAKSSDFGIVGTIDNGLFFKFLSRDLMREQIQEIWRTKFLDPSRFPLSYYLSRAVVRSVQENTWYSTLLLTLIVGLPRDRFPSGPETFLSLSRFANRAMSKGSKILYKKILSNPAYFLSFDSRSALRDDVTIRSWIISASTFFDKAYGEEIAAVKPTSKFRENFEFQETGH